jgi:hypothetical protein
LNIFFGSTIADTIAISEDIFVEDTKIQKAYSCALIEA